MAVDPTLGGLRDGTDFPHSGIFHALNIASRGSYAILDGNNFDITQSDSSGNTQFVVAAGRVFRDGEYLTEIATATFTQGTPANFDEPTGGNMYYLLVVNSSNVLEMKNHGSLTAVDIVPVPAAGDIPIAVIRLGASETVTQRHVQFLTTGKTKNVLSIGYGSSSYTEVGKVFATDASEMQLQTVTNNANIKLNPHGSGVVELTKALDVKNQEIKTTTTNGSITIAPNTGGEVVLGNSDTTELRLTSRGNRDLKVTTNSGVNSGAIVIGGSNDDLTVTPHGTGQIVLDGLNWPTSDGSANQFLKTDGSGQLSFSDELDSLSDVTGRGGTTTDEITIGGLVNSKHLVASKKEALLADFPVAGGGPPVEDMVFYINAAGPFGLPDATAHDGTVITLKNIHTAAITISSLAGQLIDEGVFSHDARLTAANTITLDRMESITLQGITDALATLTTGWMVIDTDSDTDTGITDVVDDTTPQLGGNLDVNGNKIVSASNGDVEIEPNGTGEIVLDGDVVVKDAHTFTAPTLGNVSSSSATYNLSKATNAGKYLIYSGTGTVNLPTTSTAGEQYTILNTSSGDITVGRNGNDINGSSSDVTVGTYNGVTCIAIGSNDWIALGV